MKPTNPIATYKRLIVMFAFFVAIFWPLAGTDFLGSNTRLIISGVCGAGLIVFLIYYKEEEKTRPEQNYTTKPLIRPLSQISPAPISTSKTEVDVSNIINQARTSIKDDEIFRRFD